MALLRSFPTVRLLSCLAALSVLSLASPAVAAEDDENESANSDDGDKESAGGDEGDKKGDDGDKESDDDDGDKESDDDDGDFGHMGQFGLRASLVGGFRMIFRYD